MEDKYQYVLFISDGTGLTAEVLGEALLTQFPETKFKRKIIPYVNSVGLAHDAINEIQALKKQNGNTPIVFSTLVDDGIRDIIANSGAKFFDLFATFIDPLEKILDSHSVHKKGQMRGIKDYDHYHYRVSALNYALNHDDGLNQQSLKNADVVIIGVSRCGKTPTALYLAMQFSIKAANYPLINEDLEMERLPEILRPYKNKLIGLNISPEKLSRIRQERRANSEYATLKQCKKEIKQALNLFQLEDIPYLDTSSISIEEIASRIIQKLGLRRINY